MCNIEVKSRNFWFLFEPNDSGVTVFIALLKELPNCSYCYQFFQYGCLRGYVHFDNVRSLNSLRKHNPVIGKQLLSMTCKLSEFKSKVGWGNG